MNSIQFSKLLLACLVIFSFVGVGVAIAFRSILWITLLTIIGFLIMGVGLSLKRKQSSQSPTN